MKDPTLIGLLIAAVFLIILGVVVCSLIWPKYLEDISMGRRNAKNLRWLKME